MRIECTQCDWLKNRIGCLKGRNVNHAGYCDDKYPPFDINKIGNMIHVSKEDYDEIKEGIIVAAENETNEVNIEINDITFVIDINVNVSYVTMTTGVKHMGEEETYQEKYIDSIKATFRGAYNKDGDEVETDFLNYKIASL